MVSAQAQCDQRLHKLMESVLAAQTDDGCGFAAVKVRLQGLLQVHVALQCAVSTVTFGCFSCLLHSRNIALGKDRKQ